MPIALDPQDKRLFWLDSDSPIPLPTRPVFECVAATGSVMRKYRALMAEAEDLEAEAIRLRAEGKRKEAATATDAIYAKLAEVVKLGVTGWRNFTLDPAPATVGELIDCLEERELTELANGWPIASRITEADRKNSLSPPPTGVVESAATALADATTNPAPAT